MFLWMFNKARPFNRSSNMVDRKYVFKRLIVEKLLSAVAVETERVANIVHRVFIAGKKSLQKETIK